MIEALTSLMIVSSNLTPNTVFVTLFDTLRFPLQPLVVTRDDPLRVMIDCHSWSEPLMLIDP